MAPSTDDTSRDGPPRSLLIAAVALAVGAVIAVLAIAVIRYSPSEQQPVPISSVPAPQAESAECGALIDALPEEMGVYRRAIVETTDMGVAAWEVSSDAEPVILRCGLDRPAEFVVGAPIQVVDDVQWFEVGDEGRSSWFAVDRAVYIVLTLPRGSGPTPIQEISEAISQTMPATPIKPAPVR